MPERKRNGPSKKRMPPAEATFEPRPADVALLRLVYETPRLLPYDQPSQGDLLSERPPADARSPINVMIADHEAFFRDSIRAYLESANDLTVVAEAASGFEAVEAAERARPDVAVVEADLQNCGGVQAIALIRERVPDCRVLVITDQEDDGVLLDAILAGARGYITKQAALDELVHATRAVHRGYTPIPAHMVDGLLEHLVNRRREHDEARQRIARLTAREKQVLALLADGSGNRTIARALVISPQTARTHVQNVLGKLGLHSRLEAAAFFARTGIGDELLRERA
jgi:two-component system, NarL family, nitrate/nitrite response regulator NarL